MFPADDRPHHALPASRHAMPAETDALLRQIRDMLAAVDGSVRRIEAAVLRSDRPVSRRDDALAWPPVPAEPPDPWPVSLERPASRSRDGGVRRHGVVIALAVMVAALGAALAVVLL